jgi:hypothetical protein
MAIAALFGTLALGLGVIAVAAWRGGLEIAAVSAAILAVWLLTMAATAARRARR